MNSAMSDQLAMTLHRRDDPETSRAAAESVVAELPKLQRLVFGRLKDIGGEAIDAELVVAVPELGPSSVRTLPPNPQTEHLPGSEPAPAP